MTRCTGSEYPVGNRAEGGANRRGLFGFVTYLCDSYHMIMFIGMIEMSHWSESVGTSLSTFPESTRPSRTAFEAPNQLRAALEGIATTLSFASGEHVFTMGDAADGVYIVLTGSVRASLSLHAGRDLVCRILGPGSLLGLPSAMCSKSHQFTAETVEDSTLGFIETSHLNDFLRGRTDLCMQVVGMMSNELSELRETQVHMQSCTHMECSLHSACICCSQRKQ